MPGAGQRRQDDVFDRAARALRLVDVRELTLDDPTLVEAAELFGLRIA